MEVQDTGDAIAGAPSPPSDNDLDSVVEHPGGGSPLASTEVADGQPPSPQDQPQPSELEDLRRKIIKQVEYYFSDENLPKDNFMLKHVMNNDGFVPIGLIASFRKMKKLTKDTSLIVAALRESTFLVVSRNGKRVKRLHPLSLTDVKDTLACTVVVENFPENHSLENLRKIFSEAGKITNIIIRNPQDAKESQMFTVDEKFLSRKLYALVEYENMEAAEKAVATLNNEEDWRYGLRVKPLKKLVKEPKKKTSKKLEPEKGSNNEHKSETPVEGANRHTADQNDDSQDDKDEDNPSKQKNGTHLPYEKKGQKAQNRGRGRGMKYPITNGHGIVAEPSKPPPGPRMPDGTRGFAMGRGRPPPLAGW